MIEGRVSAGVVIGADSDLGGSCSTMGTLSGGGTEIISVGENCLIGRMQASAFLSPTDAPLKRAVCHGRHKVNCWTLQYAGRNRKSGTAQQGTQSVVSTEFAFWCRGSATSADSDKS